MSQEQELVLEAVLEENSMDRLNSIASDASKHFRDAIKNGSMRGLAAGYLLQGMLQHGIHMRELMDLPTKALEARDAKLLGEGIEAESAVWNMAARMGRR